MGETPLRATVRLNIFSINYLRSVQVGVENETRDRQRIMQVRMSRQGPIRLGPFLHLQTFLGNPLSGGTGMLTQQVLSIVL